MKNGVSVRIIFRIEECMPFLSVDFMLSILLGCSHMYYFSENSVEDVYAGYLLHLLDILCR